MNSSDIEVARAVAFRFVGYSARSRHELQVRLKKADVSEDVIATVLAEFEAAGYIDDEKFAADWISDRADRKRYGKTRLSSELNRKGVGSDYIKEAIGSISEEDEVRRAFELTEAKWPSEALYEGDGEQFRALDQKLSQFLQRRGFGWNVVKQVLNLRSENRKKLS